MTRYQTIRLKWIVFIFSMIMIFSLPSHGQGFSVVESKEGAEISENGKKILFYQQMPKSQNGQYSRAGYAHPVYTLKGNEVTEDFPEDHPYHRGIFWAWHQIILNDKRIADGWTCENITWLPEQLKVKKSRKQVSIESKMLWQSPIKPGESTSFLRETAKVSIYKATPHYRLLDFDIRFLPLINTLELGGSEDHKGYGGFCIRLKLPKDIQFVSDGKKVVAEEPPVTAAPWMDFRGSFDGNENPVTGVTLFCPVKDPSSTQSWILREQTSMQNAVYPGNQAVAVPATGLRLTYRVMIHDGTLTPEEIKKLYLEYVR